MQVLKKITLLVILIINTSIVFANEDEFRPLTEDSRESTGLTTDEIQSFNKNLSFLNGATLVMLFKLRSIDVSPSQRKQIILDFIHSIPESMRLVLEKIGYFEFEIFDDIDLDSE